MNLFTNGMYDYLRIIIKIHDQLQIISKDGAKQAGSIIDIRLIKSQGFYAPLTYSGKLVVDSILVIQPYRWWIYFIG